jgi:carbonic anhydrase
MSRTNGFIGRRSFLHLAGIGSLGVAATAAGSGLFAPADVLAQQPKAPTVKPNPVNPNEALQRLLAGNQRFVSRLVQLN